ncbi:hypothetical protein GCM10007895_03830 [Paraferrimonas sedimenticola]|uniref:PA domain-containing protein n=1 Tax=Paraferrimonas sedimenticola TaxID=375674 RepID=A0AA37RV29_9GAMM|nr:hypothetical protein GCM10007895_03830 [Paraferrimonas sedimenticola]
MKLTRVSAVISAALYATGVAAAASSSAPTLSDARVLKPAYQPIKASAVQSQATNSIDTSKLQSIGGVNQIIAQPKQKFVWENGLSGEHSYIVRLKQQPVASYTGGLADAPISTQAAIQANQLSSIKTSLKRNSAVQQYRSVLEQQQTQVISKAAALGVSVEVEQRYTYATNGFSARMTQEQAQRLSQLGEVEFVQRAKPIQISTDVGPQHIGAESAWLGDNDHGLAFKGEGIIVGVLDTGINTQHPAFAATGDDGYTVKNPYGEGVYVGDCAIEGFEHLCNSKLIGVRSYSDITSYYDGIAPENGEDYQGHGSHVAGTAAGNVLHQVPYVVPEIGQQGDGINTGLEMGTISGVAPHANIISYQVCFAQGLINACDTPTVLKAIDDAIADGVDVINFSVGGGEMLPWIDATEMAFLAAREAGIVVAAAVGNDAHLRADHSSPWLMAVAASTHSRSISAGEKLLSNPTSSGEAFPESKLHYLTQAKGVSDGITGKLVYAADYGNQYCIDDFAENTFAADEIVLCERGYELANNIARVAKADKVMKAGAGGFLLFNSESIQDLYDDLFPLPGANISYEAGNALVSWKQTAIDPQITIEANAMERHIDESNADKLAQFSSRGPSRTYVGNIFPSLTAPGVNIYAPDTQSMPFADPGMVGEYSL